MVELEAIESEGCVSCMMLRTEVFFMYASKKTRSGYLWMTQVHADLLDVCISKKACTNLWYNEAGKKLVIPKDLSPWSHDGLKAYGFTRWVHKKEKLYADSLS